MPAPRHKSISRRTRLAATLGFSLTALFAQDTSQVENTAAPLPRAGPQVRSLSVYGVYYSSFLPNAGATFSSTQFPADMGAGGSLVLAWTKFTERTSFSLTYTPSYTAYARNSSLNALNHAFSLTASRKIAPRWTLSLSAAGSLSSLEQSTFAPQALSNVASAPATFNDLASGLLAGNFAGNPQLGSLLKSAPLLESPLGNLLYGLRMFTTSAQASLTHSYSPRLSISFSGSGARAQHMSDGPTRPGAAYLLPDTTSGSATIALSYSLSPLTQLGVTTTATRTLTSVYDAYATISQVTLGHAWRTKWLMQIHGGVAATDPLARASLPLQVKPGPVAGGTLAYKSGSFTLLGTYDRTVIDSYGLGAATTSTATGSWHFRRPGSAWWLDGGLNYQQLWGDTLANTSGWHLSASLSRAMGTHIVCTTQLVHLEYSGGARAAFASRVSQDALRASIEWTPHTTAGQ